MNTINKYRGDDWDFTVTITDDTGTPYNLTGATLVSTIGGIPGWSGTPTVTDAPNGVCVVNVPHATTALFAPGTYQADVQTEKAGVRLTAAKWIIRVLADVTIP